MNTSVRRLLGRPSLGRSLLLALALAGGWLAPEVRAQAQGCASGNAPLAVGDTTSVCLFVSSLPLEVGSDYSPMIIKPDLDDFSRFYIPGSYSNALLNAYNSDVYFHLESEGGVSFAARYRDSTTTSGPFTAIISMVQGEVTGISFDAGCSMCSTSACVENEYAFSGDLSSSATKQCTWTNDECVNNAGEPNDLCQLTVYVVWSGTDKSGRTLQSKNFRLSEFAGRAVSGYISDAQSTASTVNLPF
jgi:hypothetical protein